MRLKFTAPAALLLLALVLAGPAAPAEAEPVEGQVRAEDLAAPGETASAPTTAPAPGALPGEREQIYGLGLIKAAGAFLAVLLVLYLALKALGRLGGFKGAKGARGFFRLKGTLSLDSRKYLAAVEVDGRLLVVGVSPDKVEALAHWPLGDAFPDPFKLDNPDFQDAAEKDVDLDLADVDVETERRK